MQISTNAGGSLEICEAPGARDEAALSTYLALTNYIKNPRVLQCPTSTNSASINWQLLARSNVSYFISANVFTNVHNLVVWGDSNIEYNKTKLPLYPRFNHLVDYQWTRELHRTKLGKPDGGYVAFMDGSVKKPTDEELNSSIEASVFAYKLESSTRKRREAGR